jgi:hypothetical protein
MRFVFSSVLMALISAGCGGGGDSELAGSACTVKTEEPVLTIRSASNALSGSPISEITLSNIKVNGAQVESGALAVNSNNVSVADGKLICTLPCAFGSNQSQLSFSATAGGFLAKEVAVDASYAVRVESCPIVLRNGTKVDIVLNPNQ